MKNETTAKEKEDLVFNEANEIKTLIDAYNYILENADADFKKKTLHGIQYIIQKKIAGL